MNIEVDSQSLSTIVNNAYLVAGTLGIVGAGIAGVLGYHFGSKTQISDKTRMAQIEVQRAEANNAIKLKEMQYVENQKEYDRETQRENRERQFRLDLISKLVELKPVLQSYLETLRQEISTQNADYEKQRQCYRTELVEEYMSENKDSKFDTGDYVGDEDAMQHINHLVDLKYPPRERNQLPVPIEIRALIREVLGSDALADSSSNEDSEDD